MAGEEMTQSMRDAMSLAGDVHRLGVFYDGWAATYDADVASHGYGLPEMMIATLRQAVGHLTDPPTRAARVLDAGCGTGLVGVALHGAGFTDLHGVDLSEEMVDVARRRGVYRSLEAPVDLTAAPDAGRRARYDVVTVGGVFTVGHVAPSALETIASYCRPGGVLVASTRAAYQDDTDFVATQRTLVDAGRVTLLVHAAERPYTMDSTGDYWAWQVGSDTGPG